VKILVSKLGSLLVKEDGTKGSLDFI